MFCGPPLGHLWATCQKVGQTMAKVFSILEVPSGPPSGPDGHLRKAPSEPVARQKGVGHQGSKNGGGGPLSLRQNLTPPAVLELPPNRWPKAIQSQYWEVVRWLNKDVRERHCANCDGRDRFALEYAARAIREAYSSEE